MLLHFNYHKNDYVNVRGDIYYANYMQIIFVCKINI
nr:MAG TPA: hypothetical protein [Caudoviricetes sp.]